MTRLLYIPSYLLNPLDSCATIRIDLLATSFSAESRTKRRLHRRTSCTGMRTTRRTKIINNLVFRVTCTKGLTEGFDRNSRALEDGTAIGMHDPDPCRRDVWTRTVRRDADGTVTERRDDDNEHHHDVDVGV